MKCVCNDAGKYLYVSNRTADKLVTEKGYRYCSRKEYRNKTKETVVKRKSVEEKQNGKTQQKRQEKQ